jgi:acetyl/propionyl-CoA carboxylase alpha subunit
MLRVLRNTHLFGIQSNIEFLVSIFEDEEFRSAKLSTSYLGAAKVTELLQRIMTRRSVFEKFSKDLAQFAASRLKVHSQESQDFFYRWFELRTAGPMEIVTPAEVVNYRGLIGLSFDASFQQQKLQKYFVFATPLRVYINSEGALVSLRRLADFEAEILSQSESSAGSSLAPVPGRVVRINFTNGSMVKRGDTVLVLESMKMEFEIRADTSGVIKNITAQEGTLVQAKARLFEIESP